MRSSQSFGACSGFRQIVIVDNHFGQQHLRIPATLWILARRIDQIRIGRARRSEQLFLGRLLKPLKSAAPEKTGLWIGLLCSQASESLLRTEDDGFDFAFVLGVLLGEQVHDVRHFVLVAARIDGEALGIAGFGTAAIRLVRFAARERKQADNRNCESLSGKKAA